MVKRLQAMGFSEDQAAAVKDLLKETVDDAVLRCREEAQTEMQKQLDILRMQLETKMHSSTDTLKSDVARHKQELERVRVDFRFELEKVTAAQRLDLNLEKGRMKDSLNQSVEAQNARFQSLDGTFATLRLQIEESKLDGLKCVQSPACGAFQG